MHIIEVSGILHPTGTLGGPGLLDLSDGFSQSFLVFCTLNVVIEQVFSLSVLLASLLCCLNGITVGFQF